MKALGEARRDLVPHHMNLRIAVNEEQRRAVAALLESDARTRGLDALVGEAVERGNTSDRFDHPPLPISKLIDNNLSWILVLIVSWVDVHGLSTWQSLKSSQSREFGHCAATSF